tara:strand:+ start:1752 stop:2057 length:306 start_codon:yes stop_codon:yes gene_type:complete
VTKKKSKPRKLYDKERQAAKLANKALKDKPKWKPAKGYKYLKDLAPGSGFRTQTGMAGILLECTTNAKVIIGDVPNIAEQDKQFYIGRRTIASTTEVKEIK